MTRTFLFLPVNKSLSSPLFKVSNVFTVSFKIFWFICLLIYLLTLFNVDYKTLAAYALIKINYPPPLS